MKFEAADWIAIAFDVLASLAVTGFARDAELSDLRIPFVAFDKTRLPLRDMAIHTGTVPCTERIIFL